MIAELDQSISFQLSVGQVDSTAGILRGVTVAKAGVIATGKFIMVDGNGNWTLDPTQARRKLPATTDETTLDTLITAVEAAGGKLRVRIDHDDSIAARVGSADNFHKTDDGRVVADIHINDSCTQRAAILEISLDTPTLIGMSIDFLPSFEITKDAAVMRIDEIRSVDVVDEGAITPDGMFMSRGREVNSEALDVKINQPGRIDPPKPMADKTQNPPIDSEKMADAIKTISARCDAVEASNKELAAQYAGLKDAHQKLIDAHQKLLDGSKPAAPAADDPAAAAAASLETQIQAGVTKAVNAMRLELKQEAAALGTKAGDVKAVSGDPGKDPATQKAKTYLELVAEAKASGLKLGAFELQAKVQHENPESYRLHLTSKGVAK
jgi:hypothetical protein